LGTTLVQALRRFELAKAKQKAREHAQYLARQAHRAGSSRSSRIRGAYHARHR
jgi:hypothetical protein